MVVLQEGRGEERGGGGEQERRRSARDMMRLGLKEGETKKKDGTSF